ncbi:MAG: glycosyltransferase [archaeon]|jgi:glycosyltransferase involved in cell wall biosynthesis
MKKELIEESTLKNIKERNSKKITNHEKELIHNLKTQLQEKNNIISYTDEELSSIKKSLSFKLANVYRKMINNKLPLGTSSRDKYDSFLRTIKKSLVTRKAYSQINLYSNANEKGLFKNKKNEIKKFNKTIDKAYELGREEEYEKAWELIENLVEETKKSFKLNPQKPFSTKIKKIAIVASTDLTQCNLYRVEQKKEQLKNVNIECDIINYRTNLDKFYKNLYQYNAVIFYRTPVSYELIETIITTRNLGIPTFYEIDDLLFDNKFYPEKFSSYGGLISKREYTSLKVGALLFKKCMELCDYGIASTNSLAQLMEEHVITKKVFVHRNALDSKLILIDEQRKNKLKKIQSNKQNPIKIFISSNTSAHAKDFENLCEEPLIKIIKKYKSKIQIIIFGNIKTSRNFKKYKNYFSIIPPTRDIELFWQTMSTMDLNLALITTNNVSNCKSEIKWMETGYFGIPSIVSPTENYTDVIQDGVDGYLVSSHKETFTALDKLISNKNLREQIGAAAREKIIKNYNFKVSSQSIEKILNSVLIKTNKKKILVVNVFYPPYSIGGATRIVYENISNIKKQYSKLFDIEVVTSFSAKEENEVKTYYHEGVRVNAIKIPSYSGMDEAIMDSRVSKIFENILESTSPDLVHFHCVQRLTAGIVSVTQLKKIPYVITVHDGYWISPHQFLLDKKGKISTFDFSNDIQNLINFDQKYYLKYKLAKSALFGAKKIIGVSKSFAELHQSLGLNNVIAIPNGSSMNQITKKVSKSGKVRIAHIGGQNHHKGFFLFKEAIIKANLKNIEVFTVNDSISFKKPKKTFWGTTPVITVPRVPFEKVNQIYENIDVLAAPSIWPESYGLVVREALNQGMWVIASDRGAVSESITKDNGFIISVETITPLVKILKKIDSNPEKYLKQINIKPKIRKPEEQAKEIAFLYKKLLLIGEIN